MAMENRNFPYEIHLHMVHCILVYRSHVMVFPTCLGTKYELLSFSRSPWLIWTLTKSIHSLRVLFQLRNALHTAQEPTATSNFVFAPQKSSVRL